jgi:ABC-type transport system substrate-binding protein
MNTSRKILLASAVVIAALAAWACGETVIQTVVVEKEVQVQGETIIQTVVVEKQIQGETVVQTVVVEKEVEVMGETVVQTVVVEKEVLREVVKEVEKIVEIEAPEATATASLIGTIGAPDPKTEGGAAVIGFAGIGQQVGRNANQASDALKNWGVAETLFRRGASDETLPWVATDWTISPDLTTGSVTIQDGITFRTKDRDFGTLTADDVAWSMNDANNATNRTSIHGQAGDFAGLWGEWRVIDESTVEWNFATKADGSPAFDGTWKDDYVNQSGQAFPVLSKNAWETEGDDFVRDTVVASGPYLIDTWIADDRIVLTADDGHWKFSPKTSTIILVQAGDPTNRATLLRTGQIDTAQLEPKDAANLIVDSSNWGQSGTGGAIQLGIFFSGNLWESTDAKSGELLPPKGPFVHDHAWIGNSDSDKHGADDMQQSRNIRYALAIAVDRAAVNDSLLAGLGNVVQVEYFAAGHPNYSGVQCTQDGEVAFTDEAPAGTGPCTYEYDPIQAVQIIKSQDADWIKSPVKSDILGNDTFEVSVYAGPELGGGASVTGEVADAVAGYWSDIGLSTFSLKFTYVTFRPTVVNRANVHPWITSCDKGRESNPWHFPKGLVQTSLTRGGFACGFESPKILELYEGMAAASDTAEATDFANRYLQYVYYWNLQPGVVAVPNDWFWNRNKFAAWPQDRAAASAINNLWDLELAQ